ncbi:MAG TPA: hypothetical protein VHW05_00165 [Phenylobacterium sp.]|nr:hypothetical protein [Phenylobacterium sp.]
MRRILARTAAMAVAATCLASAMPAASEVAASVRSDGGEADSMTLDVSGQTGDALLAPVGWGLLVLGFSVAGASLLHRRR